MQNKNMKAIKLELREVEMFDETWNAKLNRFDRVKQGTFFYHDATRQVLVSHFPDAPHTTEDVIHSVAIYGRIKEAMVRTGVTGPASVLLNAEEYAFLLKRLNGFRWALAHPVIVEFIQYVRNLKEVEVTESQPSA